MSNTQRFEGPNLERLLEEVRASVGPDARIAEANRLRKGGIAGFFASERFEVLVEVDEPAASHRPGRTGASIELGALGQLSGPDHAGRPGASDASGGPGGLGSADGSTGGPGGVGGSVGGASGGPGGLGRADGSTGGPGGVGGSVGGASGGPGGLGGADGSTDGPGGGRAGGASGGPGGLAGADGSTDGPGGVGGSVGTAGSVATGRGGGAGETAAALRTDAVGASGATGEPGSGAHDAAGRRIGPVAPGAPAAPQVSAPGGPGAVVAAGGRGLRAVYGAHVPGAARGSGHGGGSGRSGGGDDDGDGRRDAEAHTSGLLDLVDRISESEVVPHEDGGRSRRASLTTEVTKGASQPADGQGSVVSNREVAVVAGGAVMPGEGGEPAAADGEATGPDTTSTPRPGPTPLSTEGGSFAAVLGRIAAEVGIDPLTGATVARDGEEGADDFEALDLAAGVPVAALDAPTAVEAGEVPSVDTAVEAVAAGPALGGEGRSAAPGADHPLAAGPEASRDPADDALDDRAGGGHSRRASRPSAVGGSVAPLDEMSDLGATVAAAPFGALVAAGADERGEAEDPVSDGRAEDHVGWAALLAPVHDAPASGRSEGVLEEDRAVDDHRSDDHRSDDHRASGHVGSVASVAGVDHDAPASGRTDDRVDGTRQGAPGAHNPRTGDIPAHAEVELVRIGLPGGLCAASDGSAVAAEVDRISRMIPTAGRLPDLPGAVVAVVGDASHALDVAHQIAAELHADADTVLLAATGSSGRAVPEDRRVGDPLAAEERRRSTRRRRTATVVAVAATRTLESTAWASGMLDALEPTMVWGVVDAGRKPEDVRRWCDRLGGVDALAVHGLADTVSPAAVLHAGVPVGRLDGEPATPTRWADVLTAALPA